MKKQAKIFLLGFSILFGFIPASSSSRAFSKDGGNHRGPDLLSGEELTILGRDNITFFGREISSGDVNGDGAADLIVSAPYGNSINEVRAEVFVFPGPLAFRQTLSVPQRAGFILQGDPFDSELGEDLDAGDFNGDGYDDLVVFSRPANAAYLYLGTSEIRAGSPKTVLAGPGTAAVTVKRFNTGLGVCDLNGDRRADLFVIEKDEFEFGVLVLGVLGRPEWSEGGHAEFDLQAGQADITVTLPRVVGWAWPTSGNLGCGDVDGDGTPDLVFGAFGEEDAEQVPFAGRVYMIRGDRSYAPGQPVTIQLPDRAGAVIYRSMALKAPGCTR